MNNINDFSILKLNIHGYKYEIHVENKYKAELLKYYDDEFIYEGEDVELIFKFYIDTNDEFSNEFKRTEGVEIKWQDVYFIDHGKEVQYLIPFLEYPPVLIHQIINGTSSDRLVKFGIMPLHAAAISKRKEALILVGEQKSGKTTLSLSLAQHGYNYFSDDIALLNINSKEIVPYYRGINPRESTIKMFPFLKEQSFSHPYIDYDDRDQRWSVELKKASGIKLSQKSSLKYIIFPKYKPCQSFQCNKLSKSKAIVMLLNNMKVVPTALMGSSVINVLNNLLNNTEIYSIKYSDSNSAIEFVDSLYGSDKSECS